MDVRVLMIDTVPFGIHPIGYHYTSKIAGDIPSVQLKSLARRLHQSGIQGVGFIWVWG